MKPDNLPAVYVPPKAKAKTSKLDSWKSQFYKLPNSRYRSGDEMANVSAMAEAGLDMYFIRYMARSMYRKDTVGSVIRVLQNKAINACPSPLRTTLTERITSGRDSFDAIFKDVFTLFYVNHPRVRSDGPDTVTQTCQAIMRTRDFNELRKVTVNDAVSAAAVAILILSSETLTTVMAEGAIDGLEEENEKGARPQGAQKEVTDRMQKAANGAASSASMSFEGEIKEMLDTLLDAAKQLSCGAGAQCGIPGKIDISEVEALSSIITKVMSACKGSGLQHLIDILGRMEGIFSRGKAESIHGDGEVVDVGTSNDITKSLLGEVGRLALPEFEILTLKKITEGLLLSKLRRGVSDTGLGPLVVCIDVSGSMQSTTLFEGQYCRKDHVTNAFALEAARYAASMQRKIAILPFNDSVVRASSYIPKEYDCMSDTAAGLAAAVTCEASGGTVLYTALDQAVSIIETSSTFERADVVVFTDGDIVDPDGCRNLIEGRYKELGIRTYGVVIDQSMAKMQRAGFTLVVSTYGHGGIAAAMQEVVKALNEHAFDIE